MKGLLIVLAVVLVVLLLIFYKHFGLMCLHTDVENLDRVVKTIFEQAEKPVVSQNRFIRGLKDNLGVNEKMALKLIGQARNAHLIKVTQTEDGPQVTMAETEKEAQ